MISMTKRVQEKEVKYMPLELVCDYVIKVYHKKDTVFEKHFEENNKRLSVIDLPESVTGDRVVLEVHSTYGSANARVFEIRIY